MITNILTGALIFSGSYSCKLGEQSPPAEKVPSLETTAPKDNVERSVGDAPKLSWADLLRQLKERKISQEQKVAYEQYRKDIVIVMK